MFPTTLNSKNAQKYKNFEKFLLKTCRQKIASPQQTLKGQKYQSRRINDFRIDEIR